MDYKCHYPLGKCNNLKNEECKSSEEWEECEYGNMFNASIGDLDKLIMDFKDGYTMPDDSYREAILLLAKRLKVIEKHLPPELDEWEPEVNKRLSNLEESIKALRQMILKKRRNNGSL